MSRHLILSTFVLLLTMKCGVASADEAPSSAALAQQIDSLLAQAQQRAQATPAAVADDSEFLRRIYLDLTGRIPTVAESRAFLTDASPTKRQQLIRNLVASGSHARHLATFWRRTWIPQADTPQFRRLTGEFESWLTRQLTLRRRYNEIVRDLLTVAIDVENLAEPGSATERRVPDTFLSASQRLPENLAANTTRAFLGVNLDCAQCHDHPFSRWTQEQFWETAAFFTRPIHSEAVSAASFAMLIPETQNEVQATLFTGDAIAWPATMRRDSGREVLADWVTSPTNPYFARNAVNRLWAYYFGLGLVEPIDDLSEENPAIHPAILEQMTQAFVASGYDLQYLSEAIVMTDAYQRTSKLAVDQPSQTDPHLYLRARVRGLTGEQLYRSLRTATGLPIVRHDLDPTQTDNDQERFVTEFFVEDTAKSERSILQALALMNGTSTTEAVDTQHSPLLKGLADAPFLNQEERTRALFLATLSREPTAAEAKSLLQSNRGPTESAMLSDLMWALLNSAEFNTNH